jgi:hypothetical protein
MTGSSHLGQLSSKSSMTVDPGASDFGSFSREAGATCAPRRAENALWVVRFVDQSDDFISWPHQVHVIGPLGSS